MVHLGFPVRIVGKPSLLTHNQQRNPNHHLSLSLLALRDILNYLRRIDVHLYRLSPELIPPAETPEAITAISQQIDECADLLHLLAEHIRQQQVRLTMHLAHFITLTNEDTSLTERSIAHICLQAMLLDALQVPADGVVVIHAGRADLAALKRFANRYLALPDYARRRLVVEHDTTSASLDRLLVLHQWCGIPLVFDYLHHQLYNPQHIPTDIALGLALASWHSGMRPKVHLSTPRTEAHLLPPRKGETAHVLPPRPGQHADFVSIADLCHILTSAQGLPPFDLMIEAKAGDLAVLRLRSQIAQHAPALAAMLA
jgi:UV DNA damage endonuclease